MALAQQQRHRLVSISLNLASHSAKSFSLKLHQGECFFFLKDQVPLKNRSNIWSVYLKLASLLCLLQYSFAP
jgi:hypothetical protein